MGARLGKSDSDTTPDDTWMCNTTGGTNWQHHMAVCHR